MSKNNKATEKLIKLAASDDLASMGLVLQSALRVTQSFSKDSKAQDKYIENIIRNLSSSESSNNKSLSIPKIPSIPMFEDMYGNKMGDSEFHIMVYKQLMGMAENETDWVVDLLRPPPGE